MGIAKSAVYNIADPELGEDDEIVNFEFKHCDVSSKDWICLAYSLLPESKLEYFLRD